MFNFQNRFNAIQPLNNNQLVCSTTNCNCLNSFYWIKAGSAIRMVIPNQLRLKQLKPKCLAVSQYLFNQSLQTDRLIKYKKTKNNLCKAKVVTLESYRSTTICTPFLRQTDATICASQLFFSKFFIFSSYTIQFRLSHREEKRC